MTEYRRYQDSIQYFRNNPEDYYMLEVMFEAGDLAGVSALRMFMDEIADVYENFIKYMPIDLESMSNCYTLEGRQKNFIA